MSDEPAYRVDIARHDIGVTGIYVRAVNVAGMWNSVDIAELERDSLHRWLRSRGGVNLFAENCVLVLLGHPAVSEAGKP